VTDITARKQSELALMENNRRKDEFLAMLAHELRNPLAPISHVVEVFQQMEPQNATIDYARAILGRQVLQLRRLVDDLLDISRVTRGLITIKKEPLDISALMSRAVETISPSIQGRNQELTVDLPVTPIWVEADAVRLTQVFANVLDNASKFSAAGGTIALRAHQEDDQVVVVVKDNGLGIEADMLPQIFELFAQANKSLARESGGLGIGLTLVRELVRMHDGKVEATSAGLGAGTEVTVRLPVCAPRREESEASHHSRSTDQGRRILLIDDNIDSVQSLALIVRSWGHEVQTASSGEQGLTQATMFHPDVVVLDIGMPGMDGYAVAERLREQLRNSLLIGLSGYGRDENRERALQTGFDHYLVKPAELNRLRDLIETV
jgi:CheY-like chemotaxis protein